MLKVPLFLRNKIVRFSVQGCKFVTYQYCKFHVYKCKCRLSAMKDQMIEIDKFHLSLKQNLVSFVRHVSSRVEATHK